MDSELRSVEALREEIRGLNQCINQLELERNALKTDRDTLQLRSDRRAEHAKRARRLKKKVDKLLTLMEDRSFQAGFDVAVKRVHVAGWDYKQILEDFEDPITRPEEPNVPLEVSSGPESELSD